MAEEDPPDGAGEPPLRIPIEDVLDLHTFRPADVQDLVSEYLTLCREQGFERVRVIHGRGMGVLRETVRATLARHPAVMDFHDAEPAHGGWGATVVRLVPRARTTG